MPEDQLVTPIDQEPAGDSGEELETLRAQIAALQEEREAVEAIAAELQAADVRAEQLRAELAEVRMAQLAAHRRAVLAEHRGLLVEELVGGESPDAIDTSVQMARAAYDRVAGQLRQQAAAVVPAGASPRGEPSPDRLSPFEKIAGALKRSGA